MMSRAIPCPLSASFALAMAIGAAAAACPYASAAAASPFQAFVGYWTGGGEVIGSNGVRERIRCRANDNGSRQGEALSQTIVCASPSYRIDIQSYARASGPNVQGTWREGTRGISGQLTGRLEGGQFRGAVVGPGFSAGIWLWSNGRRQEITIQPSSGGDIADVRIELERRPVIETSPAHEGRSLPVGNFPRDLSAAGPSAARIVEECKYLPAKPGALRWEPLKAVGRVADAA
jgi:hypothetical protein